MSLKLQLLLNSSKYSIHHSFYTFFFFWKTNTNTNTNTNTQFTIIIIGHFCTWKNYQQLFLL